MSKRALITGITGQDGSHLAELLIQQGYKVHGIVRRVALENPDARLKRIHHLRDHLILEPASLESLPSLFQVLSLNSYDEIYHLAAQSFVAESFADGFTTMTANTSGTHYVLAAMRQLQPKARFYFAGSSEMFGKVRQVPQNEDTPFHPRSPYGISKVAGYYLTMNYREAYGLYCVSGILFNHEGPRRGQEFVTRKITSTVAQIKHGLAKELRLGNLDARRDWGHAADYVRAMHLMLQQDEPDDYVISTGETHTVREFCEIAFAEVGLDYKDYVVVDPQFYRPAEVDTLCGDSSKARRILGWMPKYTFEELVREMVDSDMQSLARQSAR